MSGPDQRPTCSTCPWLAEHDFLTDPDRYLPGAKLCTFRMPGTRGGATIPLPEAYGCSMHPKAQIWARDEADRLAPASWPLVLDTEPLPPFDPLKPPAYLPATRPDECTHLLRRAGKPSPKSGCTVPGCVDGGMRGCPYERLAGEGQS